MIGRRKSLLRTVALVLALTPVSAQAGILDSVKSMFSGITGGGGGSKDEALDSALAQVEASQKTVADKQQALTQFYNDPSGKISKDSTQLASALTDMESASRGNEQMYLQFLQLRSALQKQGKDVASYEERLTQIASTQSQLEDNYVKIQQANKDAGLLEPPTATGSETPADRGSGTATATAGPGVIGDKPWESQDIQGFIDEWLSGVGLNKYGQWEGQSGSASVRSAGPPTVMGATTHEMVWRLWADDDADSNITLRSYVAARLKGDRPNIKRPDRGGGQVRPPPRPSTTLASDVSPVPAVQPATSGTAASTTAAPPPAASTAAAGAPTEKQLAEVTVQLDTSRKELESMMQSGKGNSTEAKALLQRLGTLEKTLVEMREKTQ